MAQVPDPEVFYSDLPPEAVDVMENRESTVNDGSITPKPTSRLFSPRIITIMTTMIATVLVGVAVGVGVGMKMRNQRSDGGTSTIVANTVTKTASER